MNNTNALSRWPFMRFVLAGVVWLAMSGLGVAQETVLYAFQGADGAYPQYGLISDTEGALYGAVSNEVFQLKPPAVGQTKWTKTVIASVDGTQGSLIFGPQGSLYGVSSTTVFQLTPPVIGGAAWTQTTLWSFSGGLDGAHPMGPLMFDTWGALYGVTLHGGLASGGTVFKLTAPVSGQSAWRKTVLWNFAGGADGAVPQGGLVFDHHGALYGTTAQGGVAGVGTVYQLTPPEEGLTKWRKTVLYGFRGVSAGQLVGDGAYPYGSLVFDTEGSLYGTTSQGGFAPNGIGEGTVYRLTPPPDGQKEWTAPPWLETTLHIFSPVETHHGYALGGLIFDTQGSLYGTTAGDVNDGTVFKLSPPSQGQTTWSLAVYGTDGVPNGGLIFGSRGAIYGTTFTGGGPIFQRGYGSVFEITP